MAPAIYDDRLLPQHAFSGPNHYQNFSKDCSDENIVQLTQRFILRLDHRYRKIEKG